MQLQSPAYNLVQGPLLQMLIIQAAYMKAAGLQQMAAMETLMRENFFTASITALVPGVGLMLAAGGGQRSLLQGGASWAVPRHAWRLWPPGSPSHGAHSLGTLPPAGSRRCSAASARASARAALSSSSCARRCATSRDCWSPRSHGTAPRPATAEAAATTTATAAVAAATAAVAAAAAAAAVTAATAAAAAAATVGVTARWAAGLGWWRSRAVSS